MPRPYGGHGGGPHHLPGEFLLMTYQNTMRRTSLTALLGLGLLVGCTRVEAPVLPVPAPPVAAPVVTPPAPPVTPAPAPTPGLGDALGLVEIRFENIGAETMTASAQSVRSGLQGQGLTTAGGVQLELASRGSFTTGTRGAGGHRHLYATFRVRNATSAGVASPQARSNLTFIAASTPGTVGETPMSSFLKFDGTAANPAIAPTILPTHGMAPDPLSGGARLLPGGEDLQIFTEQEVDPARFQTPTTPAALGVTRLFPYGFVVRNVNTPGSRALPPNPAAGQFDGLVTFAMKVPLQATPAEDPFSFSMMFEAVDDSLTRVTESAEEQALGSQAAARAAALNATEIAALCGTTSTGPGLKFIPSVTTAGNTVRRAKLGGDFIITEYAAPAVSAIGNTALTVPASQGLLARVQAVPTQGQPAPTLSATVAGTSARGGNVTANPDGSVAFDPKAGDGGVADTISGTVSDGSCTTPAGVLNTTINIGQRVWYVKNDAAAGDGRRSGPFATLAAAQTASGDGDIIYVYRGDGTTANQNAGITLKANQKLIGQGVPLTVGSTAVEPAGQAPTIGHTTGAAVTLPGSAAGTTEIRGLTINAGGTGAQGIAGTTFGTLTVADLSVSTTGGPALNLTTGTVNGTIGTLSSTASAGAGLTFTTVNGTLTGTSGSVTDAVGTGLNISGGALNLTYGGSLAKAATGALLSVSGGHTGTLSLTGNLNATAGTGLQFDNADGTYLLNAVSGTAALNGGDAGIDILSDSAGTFTFGPGVAITNPTGTAFRINGSAPTVTMRGPIAKASAGRVVDITDMPSGTVTFGGGAVTGGATPALTATAGDGILLSNMDGTVNFTGNTALSGGSGVDVVNGSSGTVLFSDTSSVTGQGTANIALDVNGGAPTLTYRGTLTHNAGRVVSVQNLTGGSVMVSGTVTSGTAALPTGRGVLLQNNTGGSVTFSGPSKSFYTGANPAVIAVNNTGATLLMPNGGLAITTTTGNGLAVTGGGTVAVTGVTNTITSAGGIALIVQNTTIGAGGLNFRQINATGGTHGILLNNTGSTAGLTVLGDGASNTATTTRGRITAAAGGGTLAPGSGGIIQGASTRGVSLTNTGPVVLRNMVLQNNGSAGADATRAGIWAEGVPQLDLDNLLVSGHAGNFGLRALNSGNITIMHSQWENNATTAGVEATDIWNVALENLSGTSSFKHSLFQNSREMTIGWSQKNAASGTLNIENAEVSGTTAGNGVNLSAFNTSTANLTVKGSSILNNSSTGLQYATNDASGGAVTVEQNTLSGQVVDISLAHQGAGRTVTYSVLNNTTRQQFRAGSSNSINIYQGGTSTASTIMRGTVQGNQVGNAAIANSGSDLGRGIFIEAAGAGTSTALVSGNTVRQIKQESAFYGQVAKGTATAATSPRLNLTLTGNDFQVNTASVNALAGVELVAGTIPNIGDNPTLCVNMQSNTAFVGHSTFAGVYMVTSGFTGSGTSANPTVELQGYAGAANNLAQIEAFLGSSARATTNTPAPIMAQTTGTVRAATAACPTP
ncbi:beta strand repeat-containing protein [Deinococcus arcticus]|uniref:Uncharacterized protein n=1 Tax=Deinococcus arcticus TaxID=2136176 RepID=A0A2T3W9G8_9DEIO|nr:hypothetical protein [Deinococcus arcticus]PTA68477.1 hypothetical protein C8263_06650 [Deinococcus arcticus]